MLNIFKILVKNCSLCLILLVGGTFSSTVLAQDLIVTQNGDSLNVEIVKVTEDYVQYIYHDGRKVQRIKSPKSEIKSFRYIFFSEKRKLTYKFDPNDISLRVAISAGGSWGLDGVDGSLPQFLQDYFRSVNSGWHLKGEATYFFESRFGVGVVFDQFRSRGELNNVIDLNTGRMGSLSDDIRISYLGPQLSYHINTNLKNVTFFLGGGAGVNIYRDEFRRIDSFIATGTVFGYNASVGVDFLVMENIMMGFEVSGTFGNLTDFTLLDGNGSQTFSGQDNDISRINVSFGIRFIR